MVSGNALHAWPLLASPVKLRLPFAGAEWSVFNPHKSWHRWDRWQLYGSNTMVAGKPHLISMSLTSLLHPMYLLQVIFTPWRSAEAYERCIH